MSIAESIHVEIGQVCLKHPLVDLTSLYGTEYAIAIGWPALFNHTHIKPGIPKR